MQGKNIATEFPQLLRVFGSHEWFTWEPVQLFTAFNGPQAAFRFPVLLFCDHSASSINVAD